MSTRRGKIAEVLAQARASVEVDRDSPGAAASLTEPSRPYTPAALDVRLSVMERTLGGGEKRGSSSVAQRPSGRDKLNPMNKIAYRRASSGSETSKPVPAQPDTVDETNPALEEYMSICRDINCDMAIVQAKLENADESTSAELTEKLSGCVESLCIYIKKNPETVFGDSEQCMHRLLLWMTNLFNESPYDDVRHSLSRHIFRIHLSIYTVTMTPAVAATLPIILKDVYYYFKRSSGPDAVSSTTEPELFKLDIEVILEFLRVAQSSVDLNCANSGFNFVPNESAAVSSKRRGSRTTPVTAVNPDTMLKLLQCAEYAAGCLKEYSLSKENRRRLLHLDVVSLISNIIQKIIALREFMDRRYPPAPLSVFSLAGLESGPTEDRFREALTAQLSQMEQNAVQLITALRNFALDEPGRETMLSLQVFPTLCRVTRCCISRGTVSGGDANITQSEDITSELLLSVARVSAKLSLYEDFREQINRHRPPIHLESLVQIVLYEASLCDRIMEGHTDVEWPSWHTWPLLSRIAFTLGNFTTTNDSNRLYIAMVCKCLDPIVMLLQTCTVSLLALSSSDPIASDGIEESEDGGDTRGERELADATLKMLRLMANLCINEAPGLILAKQITVLELLLNLLQVSSGSAVNEELLLNTIATSTNVGFFACKNTGSDREVDGKWEDLLITLSIRVADFLFHDNIEIVAESLRALGNFSRMRSIVQRICQIRADEAILLLLNHPSPEVALAAAGVLVNISGYPVFFDDVVQRGFSESDYPCKLTSSSLTVLLRKTSVSDISFITLILQIFYNSLVNVKNLTRTETFLVAKDTIDELVEVIAGQSDGSDSKTADVQKNAVIQGFKTAASLVLKEITLLPAR